MLDMGFRDDIEAILQEMPEERQTVFFSATMAKPIMDLTRKYQNDPHIIKSCEKKKLTVDRIEQIFYEVKPSLKMELMVRLMTVNNYNLSVVFCNTKRMTDEVTESLGSRGIVAEALHGDLSQAQRDKVMGKFRKGICNVLVATDVAARGIDVDNVEAVFNFDLPLDEEYYVHRIGRTGRAGKSGVAVNFVTGRRDTMKIKDLERFTKASINKMDPPSVNELIDMKKAQLVKDVHRTLAKEEDNQIFEETLGQLLTEGLTPEQIALGLIKMTMGEAVKELRDQDFSLPSFQDRRRERNDRGDRGGRFERGGRDRDGARRGERREGGRERRGGGRATEANMARLFLNLGKRDRIRPNDIVGAIAGEAGIPGRSIGGIDIFDNFSFVDVPQKDADHVIRIMKQNTIKGKSVNMEISKG